MTEFRDKVGQPKGRHIGIKEVQDKVFKARRLVLEMLYDRGYRVDADVLDLKFADFVAQFCGGGEIVPDLHALTYSTASESDPGQRVLVCFLYGPHLLHFCDEFNRQDLRLLVLVALGASGLKSSHEPILSKLFRFQVEVFRANEWRINPVRGMGLGGRREIITDQEMTRMLRENILKHVQVISMPRNFLLARYYGLQKGEAVKVKYILPGYIPVEIDDNDDDEVLDFSDRMVRDLSKPHKCNLYHRVKE